MLFVRCAMWGQNTSCYTVEGKRTFWPVKSQTLLRAGSYKTWGILFAILMPTLRNVVQNHKTVITH